MTPKQCKMARTGLGWTVRDLAEKANVMPNTVSRFENGKGAYINTEKAFKDVFLATNRVVFQGDDCVCVFGEKDIE